MTNYFLLLRLYIDRPFLPDRARAVVTLVPEDVAREALAWHGIDTAGVVVIGRRPDQRPKPAPDGLLAAAVATTLDGELVDLIRDFDATPLED